MRHRRRSAQPASLLLSVAFTSAIAADCLAYAPLNTDDAGTLDTGVNQVELYYFQIGQHDARFPGERDDSTGENYLGTGVARAFPLTYLRGIATGVEVGFSPTAYMTPTGDFSRVTNYTFSLKWRLMGDGHVGWNLAIKPAAILPSTSQQQIYGLGNALPNFGITGIASFLSSDLELHFNMSYGRGAYNANYPVGFSTDPLRTNLYSASVAPVLIVSEQTKVALDAGLNTNPNEPEQSLTFYAQIAAIFSLTPDVEFAVAYQRNAANYGSILNQTATFTSRLQMGLTYRFP